MKKTIVKLTLEIKVHTDEDCTDIAQRLRDSPVEWCGSDITINTDSIDDVANIQDIAIIDAEVTDSR